MNILVIKTSSMGDLVHCLPAVTDIARHLPDANIDWLAEQAFADVARLHPAVTKVETCAMRRWLKSPFNLNNWRDFLAIRSLISNQNYDITIDFQGLLKSAHWSKSTSGISHGYDSSSARESLASLFYKVRHRVSSNIHAVHRNRLLAALVFGYQLNSSVDFGLTKANTVKKQIILLHGSSRADKCLDNQHWQKLASIFTKEGFEVLLPWHGSTEKLTAETIAKSGGKLLDSMTIGKLAGVLAQSALVIGVDSGLVHLSAALGTPTLALYLTSNPALVGALGKKVINLSKTSQKHAELPPSAQYQPIRIERDDLENTQRIYDLAISLIDNSKQS